METNTSAKERTHYPNKLIGQEPTRSQNQTKDIFSNKQIGETRKIVMNLSSALCIVSAILSSILFLTICFCDSDSIILRVIAVIGFLLSLRLAYLSYVELTTPKGNL
ncbi:hypothetical protein GCM10026987_09030 [Belliella aquatica]|uniref:Uncharacterized protein n=1 Tax=Belliella aquatica TaxID=1323734 RepID=A0ABQ1M5S2_9BACT|nr:hypothetical protein GCM10010993_12890 [Belliella aquatica]